jgi:hypothetical protein
MVKPVRARMTSVLHPVDEEETRSVYDNVTSGKLLIVQIGYSLIVMQISHGPKFSVLRIYAPNWITAIDERLSNFVQEFAKMNGCSFVDWFTAPQRSFVHDSTS